MLASLRTCLRHSVRAPLPCSSGPNKVHISGLHIRTMATSGGSSSTSNDNEGTAEPSRPQRTRERPISLTEAFQSFRTVSDKEVHEVQGESLDDIVGGDGGTSGDFLTKYQEDRFRELKLKRYVAQVKRVVHVNKKGRLARMSATVVVGNSNGLVGYCTAKADDVISAIQKAQYKAMRNLIFVPRYDKRTILFPVRARGGSAIVTMKPTSDGYGIVAGSTVEKILELAGIRDCTTKLTFSNNRQAVVHATFKCLAQLQSLEEYCLTNKLNAVDFRRVMHRHVMYATRTLPMGANKGAN